MKKINRYISLIFIVYATVANAQDRCDMRSGETLFAGERLYSNNRQYYLEVNRYDGNLCIYDNVYKHLLWSTNIRSFYEANLRMQQDGNLVIYDRDNTPKWSSQTHPYFHRKYRNPRNKPVQLRLENNGSLKLYTASGKSVWSANTNPSYYQRKNHLRSGETLLIGQRLYSKNHKYYAELSHFDGNLCIYDTSYNRLLWSTSIRGCNGANLRMQEDGNLVIYDSGNTPRWSSQTHPYFHRKYRNPRNKPVQLRLENNGSLKLYTASGKSIWSIH